MENEFIQALKEGCCRFAEWTKDKDYHRFEFDKSDPDHKKWFTYLGPTRYTTEELFDLFRQDEIERLKKEEK